jgi:serine/threonine-protein kinase
MPLKPGTRFGHYDVTALIGEGGMGQVYRATDATLNRQVALKILPAAFAADPDRLARFRREAQVLASLNHPNIAQIYGLEQGRLRPHRAEDVEIRGEVSASVRAGGGAPAPVEDHGLTALVMELVEGPTLADRIAEGPIPPSTAIPLAKQIAEALEAAHEQGIIHRDLKPANIKVARMAPARSWISGWRSWWTPTAGLKTRATTVTIPASASRPRSRHRR